MRYKVCQEDKPIKTLVEMNFPSNRKAKVVLGVRIGAGIMSWPEGTLPRLYHRFCRVSKLFSINEFEHPDNWGKFQVLRFRGYFQSKPGWMDCDIEYKLSSH
jgi:hypothetical protein